MKYLINLLLLVFLSGNLLAQSPDEQVIVKSGRVKYFKEASLFSFSDTTSLDLDLPFFQQYNPVNSFANPFLQTGATGSIYLNPVFSLPQYFGLNSGLFSSNKNFLFSHDSLKYYDAKYKYSELRYILGTKSEQLFAVKHSQNINPYLNIGIDFRRIACEGYFLNSSTYYNNFDIYTKYHSPNRRYLILSNFIYNYYKLNQNGGIASDSVYENTSQVDNLLYPVSLKEASITGANKAFYIKQYYNLGTKRDSIGKDSTLVSLFNPLVRLSHSFLIEQNRRVYSENFPGNSLYDSIYYSAKNTFDTASVINYENRFGVAFLKGEKVIDKRPYLGFQIIHQLQRFKQGILDSLNQKIFFHDTVFQSLIGNVFLGNRSSSRGLAYSFSSNYNFNGRNSGDYDLNLILGYTFSERLRDNFSFKAGRRLHSPDYIYDFYTSNHLKWNNRFLKEEISMAGVSYSVARYSFEISASSYLLDNFLYLNTNGIASQRTHTFRLDQLMVRKDFHWEKLGWANKVYLQKSHGNELRLPEILSVHSLFVEMDLFKRALHALIGTDFRWNTAFYSNAFNPAIGLFNLQDEKKVGDFPFLDVYVNIRIKSARLFVKMDNVLGEVAGNNSYQVIHYPIPSRTLRFGISWKFFD